MIRTLALALLCLTVGCQRVTLHSWMTYEITGYGDTATCEAITNTQTADGKTDRSQRSTVSMSNCK